MIKPNPENELRKRDYFIYLREAHGPDDATIDCVAKRAQARFEFSNRARDFKRFHREQAVAFKAKLMGSVNARTGERLSKATVLSDISEHLRVLPWLAREPGFRSKIAFSDADYFNLSDKDVAIARARREPNPPTAQRSSRSRPRCPRRRLWSGAIGRSLRSRRSRARGRRRWRRFASGTSTQSRASSIRTPASSAPSSPRRSTDFHRLAPSAFEIVVDWCAELERDHAWGPGDPLFPQPEMGVDPSGRFAPIGLSRKGWATAGPPRYFPAGVQSGRASVSQPALPTVDAGAMLHGDGNVASAAQSHIAEPWPLRRAHDVHELRSASNIGKAS